MPDEPNSYSPMESPLPEGAHDSAGIAPLERLVDDLFAHQGGKPLWMAAAPGRVNLIGEHIDYNDGFVLPMAIDRYVVIGAAPLAGDPSGPSILYSSSVGETVTLSHDPRGPSERPAWLRYIEGVMAGFAERGIRLPRFRAILASNVPLGGGLSSSAALEVAVATLFESMSHPLDPLKKALLCQKAEHVFAGVPCGIMDQMSSVFGRAGELLLLDCRSKKIEPVPFQDPSLSILIANTNVKHELTGGEYAERRSQCDQALRILGKPSWRDVALNDVESARNQMSELEFRRARHVVTEIARTVEAAKAFQAGKFARVGELMAASHASLRDDFHVSCPELDGMVEIAQSIGMSGGVMGCRMTGGGFGGCTVWLVKTDSVGPIADRVHRDYHARFGIEPYLFSSRPAQGAIVLRRPAT